MTHFTGSLSLVACFSLVSCHTSEEGSRLDSGPEDAASDHGGRDASALECGGSLADAGFSSLGTFPIASWCTGDIHSSVIEYSMPCGRSMLVQAQRGPDCEAFWLFDATSGALEAEGAHCDGGSTSWTCVPGFVFPSACWAAGWETGPQKQLCVDAGPEAGSDAPQSTDGAGG